MSIHNRVAHCTILILILFFAVGDATCFAQFTDNPHMGSAVKEKVDSVVTIVSFYHIVNADSSIKELLSRDVKIYKKEKLIKSYDRSYLGLAHTGIDSRPVKTVYIYDKEGNLIEQLRYFTTGEPWVKDVYLIHGLMITVYSYYCPDNSLTETDSLKTDVAGKMLQRSTYGKEANLFSKSLFKYDERSNLLTEITYRDDGSLMFERYCKYDRDGNIIEDYNPHGDRQRHTYEYQKYDDRHNWLTQIEYINNQAMRIRDRKIYYRK
jgi:hypothetical protein